MTIFKRNRKEELEYAADAFLRRAETPAPSHALRQYGLQRIYARLEPGEIAGAAPVARRTYRNPALLHRVVLIALVVLLVMVITSTGAYAFSYNAQPDSLFYPAKIFFERARVTLTSSAIGDIALEMDYSNRRLEELENMVESGNQRGSERWLHEYLRNIEGARALIDNLTAEEFAGIAPRFQEMLDTQSHMMEGVRHEPPPELSNSIESAYEACNREREHMRQRSGHMNTDGSSQSPQDPGQGAQPSGNCGSMENPTSPGQESSPGMPSGQNTPMMEDTQPMQQPAGPGDTTSMWQSPAAGWEQAQQDLGGRGEGSSQKESL